tara:strand:- start:6117 stop:6368 length:252 start_codon:yes stop_codon:yes gene_type:complete
MDFLEGLEEYNTAMDNAYAVVTKQKDLDKLYKELNDNDKDYFSLPFNFSDTPSVVEILLDHYESLENFEKCEKLKKILNVYKN